MDTQDPETVMIDQNKSQFAIHNEDEARLAALGRKQQMKPNFNVWSSARNVLLHQQYLEAITGVLARP